MHRTLLVHYPAKQVGHLQSRAGAYSWPQSKGHGLGAWIGQQQGGLINHILAIQATLRTSNRKMVLPVLLADYLLHAGAGGADHRCFGRLNLRHKHALIVWCILTDVFFCDLIPLISSTSNPAKSRLIK